MVAPPIKADVTGSGSGASVMVKRTTSVLALKHTCGSFIGLIDHARVSHAVIVNVFTACFGGLCLTVSSVQISAGQCKKKTSPSSLKD